MHIDGDGTFDDKRVRVRIRIDVLEYYIEEIYKPFKEKNGASQFSIKIQQRDGEDFVFVKASSNKEIDVSFFEIWCKRYTTLESLEAQRKEVAEFDRKRAERELKNEDKLDQHERHYKKSPFGKRRRF